MRILITGSTGLIGSALVSSLMASGHRIVRLIRKISSETPDQILWNPSIGLLNPAQLEAFDAVIHLAGESIAGARWNAEAKRRIRSSRLDGTKLLVDALLRLSQPPRVLLSASAIGYYGDRGDELLSETSPPGEGFLPELCREWEETAQAASAKGIRVVNPRIGLVLSSRGGALARMILPFKLGLGGRVGSGKQYLSWITIDDLVSAIRHMIENESLAGPVNAVSPQACTNREFTEALGHALSRPTLIPLPAFAARLALGEMADALLLASTRVEPSRLQASGYRYLHPHLPAALHHVLIR